MLPEKNTQEQEYKKILEVRLPPRCSYGKYHDHSIQQSALLKNLPFSTSANLDPRQIYLWPNRKKCFWNKEVLEKALCK